MFPIFKILNYINVEVKKSWMKSKIYIPSNIESFTTEYNILSVITFSPISYWKYSLLFKVPPYLNSVEYQLVISNYYY